MPFVFVSIAFIGVLGVAALLAESLLRKQADQWAARVADQVDRGSTCGR